MDLTTLNEWWRTKKVPKELKGKERDALKEILPITKKRQILLIQGIRRVGKTTLMYQIIDYLLSNGVSPYRILYFTFDLSVNSIEKILQEYQKTILKKDFRNEKIYIFFDEIQKHKNWWNKIKILYDIYPNVKFFLSGSTSVLIEKNAKESLAGRVFTYHLKPLTFNEFLKFRNVEVNIDRINLFKNILDVELYQYLKTSGFVEVIHEKNDNIIQKYFSETITERIVFRDIPLSFNIDDPELLKELFKIIAENPGAIIRYSSLGNDLKRDRRTIEKYLYYLKASFLITSLYNYSTNMLTRRKKNKKFYPMFTAFSYSLMPNQLNNKAFLEKVIENLVVSEMNARFFYRNPQKEEIDIVYVAKNKPILIEVKYRTRIDSKTIKTMKKFMLQFNVSEGIIISEWSKETVQNKAGAIRVIPLMEFLLKSHTFL